MKDAAPAWPLTGAPARWLIVLAASSGGIKALRHVVSALPRDLPAAVAVVQHRSPVVQNVLPSLLAVSTPLRVEYAAHGQPILAGRVYVSRPDLHLTVSDDQRFHYIDGRKINSTLSAADPLLSSAAKVFGDRLIAVVLTGRGKDASNGVRDVRMLGGIVIAQDPGTAQEPGMPQAAIATGAVHFVEPLDQIAPLLSALTNTRDAADEVVRRRA